MLAMTIVIFVVVSILSGFTQQTVTNHFAQSKNVAITLAESKIEDFMKFPASQIPSNAILPRVDYLVEINRKMVVTTADPGKDNQYRRTTVLTPVIANPAMTQVQVTVEYGKQGVKYPFRVVLTSVRGG